jgi:class 3 adenylate cyclase
VTLNDELTAKVAEIFDSDLTERDGNKVPEPEDVGFEEAVRLNATVLYADIADSTTLVDGHEKWFSAKVYKAFLHCAATLIRARGGVITAYDCDRVMGVFIGDSKCTAAARAGLRINYAVREIINPSMVAKYQQYPLEYRLKHVVGVDTSDLYVAKTGVRGDNDLVWIGRAANYAAKLATLPETYSTYMTGEVYELLNDSMKYTNGVNMWTPLRWDTFNNATIYGSTWQWGGG